MHRSYSAGAAHAQAGASQLAPDTSAISAHLYALFAPDFVHQYPDAWIEIAYGLPEEGPNKAGFFSAFDLQAATKFAADKNQGGRNVYVGAGLRHGEKPDSGRAGDEHFLAARYSWCEYDGVDDHERIEAICKVEGMEPALMVVTGTNPHQRAHLYFLNAEPVTNGDEIKACNTALKDLFDSDDVKNPSRLMRLAGTVNYPKESKRAKGYISETTTLHLKPDAPSYSVEALRDLQPAKPKLALLAAATNSGVARHDDFDPFERYADAQMREAGRLTDTDMQALLDKHQNGGGQGWHNDLRAVTWELLVRGYDPFGIQMVIGSACKKGFDDPDIGRLVNKKWEEFQTERLEAENAASASNVPPPRFLTLDQWRERELPAPDYLLGEVFSTTCRGIMSAPTGLGKTNFALGIGMRMAAGMNFLHWEGRRAAKVFYIDGEMSRRLLKQRLLAEETRLVNELSEEVSEQFKPSGFHSLSTEDIPNFHPLNTRQGQAAIEKIIAEMGGCDFVIFDNVMSLIAGSMVDEEAWSQTLPWVKSLTKRGIGQLWVHHTGHDETKGYGTKTREWQMDVVIHLAKAERADTDVSFKLEFRKARERRPDNRADFQEVNISLVPRHSDYDSLEVAG